MVQNTIKNKKIKNNRTKNHRTKNKKSHKIIPKNINLSSTKNIPDIIYKIPKNITNKEQKIICSEFINYEPFESKLYKNNKFLSSEKYKL